MKDDEFGSATRILVTTTILFSVLSALPVEGGPIGRRRGP